MPLFFNALFDTHHRADPFYAPQPAHNRAQARAADQTTGIKSPPHWSISMHRFSEDSHSAMVICVPDHGARDIGFKLVTEEKIHQVSWQYHGFEGQQAILIAEYKQDCEYGVRVLDHTARPKRPFVIKVTFAESELPLEMLREVQAWDGEGGEKRLHPLTGFSTPAVDNAVPLGRFAFNNGMYTPPATPGHRSLAARF